MSKLKVHELKVLGKIIEADNEDGKNSPSKLLSPVTQIVHDFKKSSLKSDTPKCRRGE